MMRKAAFAALVLGAGVAQADVVYDWETIDPGNVPPFAAQLRLDESFRGRGGLEYVWNTTLSLADPSAPVLAFSVGGEGGMNLMPRLGSGIVSSSNLAFSPLAIRVQFLPDGLLGGLIFANNGNLDIGMGGGPDVWRLSDFTRDNPNAMICSSSFPPSGTCTTTGRWVLDTSDAPGRVSEPGILPLMALASLGLGITLRRRNRQRRNVPG